MEASFFTPSETNNKGKAGFLKQIYDMDVFGKNHKTYQMYCSYKRNSTLEQE